MRLVFDLKAVFACVCLSALGEKKEENRLEDGGCELHLRKRGGGGKVEDVNRPFDCVPFQSEGAS